MYLRKSPALMLVAALLLGLTVSPGREASADEITLVKDFPATRSPTVHFEVLLGASQIADISLLSGESTTIPTNIEYTAQAFVGEVGEPETIVESNAISFEQDSVSLVAEVRNADGVHAITLVTEPGRSEDGISLVDDLTAPVSFKLTRPNSDFQIVTVVDPHNYLNLKIAPEPWTVDAIADGITVSTAVTDPDSIVEAVLGKDGDPELVLKSPKVCAWVISSVRPRHRSASPRTVGIHPGTVRGRLLNDGVGRRRQVLAATRVKHRPGAFDLEIPVTPVRPRPLRTDPTILSFGVSRNVGGAKSFNPHFTLTESQLRVALESLLDTVR